MTIPPGANLSASIQTGGREHAPRVPRDIGGGLALLQIEVILDGVRRRCEALTDTTVCRVSSLRSERFGALTRRHQTQPGNFRRHSQALRWSPEARASAGIDPKTVEPVEADR